MNTMLRIDMVQSRFKSILYCQALPPQGAAPFSFFAIGFCILVALAGSVGAQPDNDAFTHREVLSGTNITADVYFVGATPDLPPPWDEAKTVWYSWTAPHDGYLGLELEREFFSSFDYPAVAVYQEPSLARLPPLMKALETRAIYSVTSGETYSLCAMNTGWAPSARLRLVFAPPPINDDFSDRELLVGDHIHFQSTAVSAKRDPDEALATGTNGRLIWWKYVAPADGRISLRSIPSGVMAFDGGELDGLTRLRGMEAQAGREYQIAAPLPSSYASLQPPQIKLDFYRYLPSAGVEDGGIYPVTPHPVLQWEPFPDENVVTNLKVWSTRGFSVETNRLVNVPLPLRFAETYTLQARAECSNGHTYVLRPTTFTLTHPNTTFETRIPLSGESPVLEADLRAVSQAWWSWMPPYDGVLTLERLTGGELGVYLMENPTEGQPIPGTGLVVHGGRVYSLLFRSEPSKGPSQYKLHLSPTPPPNDNFADSQQITGDSWSDWTCLSCATLEENEPESSGVSAEGSLWYSYWAHSKGRALVEVNGWSWPVSVFQGASLDSLQELPRDHHLQGGRHQLEREQWYHFRVPSLGQDRRSAEFTFQFFAAPDNDDFSLATQFSGDEFAFTADLNGATAEPGEPDYSSQRRSGWWRWIPESSGFAFLSIPALREGDARLSSLRVPDREVFKGETLDQLEPIPVVPLHDEVVLFPVEAGKAYHIRLSYGKLWDYPLDPLAVTGRVGSLWFSSPAHWEAYNISKVPPIQLSGSATNERFLRFEILQQVSYFLTQGKPHRWLSTEQVGVVEGPDFVLPSTNLPPGGISLFARAVTPQGVVAYSPPLVLFVRPENDDFGTPTKLAGRRVSVAATARGATLEDGEPSDSAGRTNSVWYRWTAPADGQVEVSRSVGSLSVYAGAALPDLTAVADATTSSTTFWATKGETYHLRLSAMSHFEFELHQSTFALNVATNVIPEGSLFPLSIATTEEFADVKAVDYFVWPAPRVFTATAPPFNVPWTNAPPGLYSLTASLELLSGEVLSNSFSKPQLIRVRPAYSDPGGALKVSSPEGIMPISLTGADHGDGGSSIWIQWIASADGALLLHTDDFKPVSLRLDPFTIDDGLQTPVSESLTRFSSGFSIFPCIKGRTYLLQFRGYLGSPIALHYRLISPPPNDAFADALLLRGAEAQVRSNPFLATAEPGEPDHGRRPASKSLWYQWTAPLDGRLELSGTFLAAYTGASLSQLELLPSSSSASATRPQFMVSANTTYRIAIDDPADMFPEHVWSLDFVPVPRNDQFEQRIRLEGTRTRFQAAFALAKSEGENYPDFSGSTTLWWTWTAPASGSVLLRPVPGNAMPQLAVLTGNEFSTLKPVIFPYRPFERSFFAVAGETYNIVAARRADPETIVELIMEIPPENDLVDRGTLLQGTHAQVEGANFGAGRELFEPYHHGRYGGRSLWYRWQAEADGRAVIRFDGSISAPLLAVYKGDPFSASAIASASGATNLVLSFNASAGSLYHLAVDGELGSAGDFLLELELIPPNRGPLLSIDNVNAGRFIMAISGLAGRAFTIESSTNLITWAPVESFVSGSDTQSFEMSPEVEHLYFRVIATP